MGSILRAPGLDRLGLADTLREHEDTLYRLADDDSRHRSWADHLVLYGLPAVFAAAATWAGFEITTLGPLLNGVAIIAGGLFAFLALLLGVQTIGAGSQVAAPIRVLVRETRANVSYAIVVALGLVLLMMLLESSQETSRPSFFPSPSDSIGSLQTAIVLGGVIHLVLTLLMVLNRIRIAFNDLG